MSMQNNVNRGCDQSEEVVESGRKQLVRKFYEQVWDKQMVELLPGMFQSGFTFRGSLSCTLNGCDEFKQYVHWLTSTLRDYTTEILEIVEEGELVCAKLRFHGEHQKVFFGYSPTHNRVWWDGMAVFTFDGDRVRDLWVLGDIYGLTRRLGNLPNDLEFTVVRDQDGDGKLED